MIGTYCMGGSRTALMLCGFLLGCGGARMNASTAMSVAPGASDFRRGMTLANESKWADASVSFAGARAARPAWQDASLNLAISLERAGQYEKAIDAYREVLTFAPDAPQAVGNLVRVLLEVGKISDAAAVLTPLVESHPESSEFALMHATVMRRAKRFDEADRLAREVLLREPGNVEALKSLATINADRGRLVLAETFFKNAQQVAPNDAGIVLNLGVLAHRQGDAVRALGFYEKALTLAPTMALAHANIGRVALQYRDYDRAIKELQTAVSGGVSDCETRTALGYALEGGRKGNEAIIALSDVVSGCPGTEELQITMGLICMTQLTNNKCALDHFNRYLTTHPELAKEHKVFQLIKAAKTSSPVDQSNNAGAETKS